MPSSLDRQGMVTESFQVDGNVRLRQELPIVVSIPKVPRGWYVEPDLSCPTPSERLDHLKVAVGESSRFFYGPDDAAMTIKNLGPINPLGAEHRVEIWIEHGSDNGIPLSYRYGYVDWIYRPDSESSKSYWDYISHYADQVLDWLFDDHNAFSIEKLSQLPLEIAISEDGRLTLGPEQWNGLTFAN